MVYPMPTLSGPSSNDPLTPEELSILLALPRAAEKTPNSLFIRLPKGDKPGDGHIDVSYAQACSIISRLASAWRARTNLPLCTGTTVCLLIEPSLHGVFHHLAFWALGCTVQYATTELGDDITDALLEQSGCKLVVHYGKTSSWVRGRQDKHPQMEIFALDEDEQARALACKEFAGLGPAPEWPAPQRPSPAVIIQLSATTSTPKLMSFSLHFYTLGLPFNGRLLLACLPPCPSSPKRPQTHPRLVGALPSWQSFHGCFVTHLVTATPMALIPIPQSLVLSTDDLASWIKVLDVGGMSFCPFDIRGILLDDAHVELVQSMYLISMVGQVVDQQLSDLIVRRGINAANILGMTELGSLMVANRAPYTHLRPFPDFPPPLAVPISDSDMENRSAAHGMRHPPRRDVQLWYLVSQCPQLADVALQKGSSLKLEPFPGPGPHKGELAMNMVDVFSQVNGEGDEDLAYVHIGRVDDYLRLYNDMGHISASPYELALQTLVRVPLANVSHGRWRLDAVQLFGADMPKTALVVQLLGDLNIQVNDDVIDMYDIHLLVDEVYALQVYASKYVPCPIPFTSALSVDLASHSIDSSRVHVLGGPGKAFGSVGLRIGTFISQYNFELLALMEHIADINQGCTSTDMLYTSILSDVKFRDWFLEENRRRLAAAFEFAADCAENIVPHIPIPEDPAVPIVEENEPALVGLGLGTDEEPEQVPADPNDQVEDLLLDQVDAPEVDLQLDEPIVVVEDVLEANLAMMQPVGPAGVLIPALGQVQNGGIVESPLIRSLLGIGGILGV
ncbi:aminotransferase class I and II protein [Ceratobasidium sp. AG-Ba]|nr:aminotransferase class I and II protein [Ceratobasidium sp. AG-Ba]